MALTSPGIIKAANDLLVKIGPEVAAVKQFAYDCSDAVEDYGQKVRVAMVTGGTSENFSQSANYEHETGSLSDVFVTLDKQPKSTIALTGKDVLELANAPFWNKVAEAGRNAIANAVEKSIGDAITTAIESITKEATALGTLTLAKLAGLRGKCKGKIGDTVLVLSPEKFDEALGLFDSSVYGGTEAVRGGVIPNLYGFKSVVRMELPKYDGASTASTAALIPSNAIAVATRAVAVGDESCYSEIGTQADENGFAITVMRHGSAATGKGFLNVTALVGATVVDAANIVLFK